MVVYQDPRLKFEVNLPLKITFYRQLLPISTQKIQMLEVYDGTLTKSFTVYCERSRQFVMHFHAMQCEFVMVRLQEQWTDNSLMPQGRTCY